MEDTTKKDEFREGAEAGTVEPEAETEAAVSNEETRPEDTELEAIRAERNEFYDQFLRALAEAENMRKRADKDRREAARYGGSKLSRDLLPVYDNLKRALDTVTNEQREANAALLEGIELTQRELLNVFSRHGIEPVSPKVGDAFNAQLHEAVFEAPVPDAVAGEIVQVEAEGFRLHDRLLRPARVGVSSTPKS